MGDNVLDFFVQRNKGNLCDGLVNITTNIKKEEAMGAEEEKKTWELPANKRG